MINIPSGSILALMQASTNGPFMQAEIISLTGHGKLRVTCNWLYSSLNCDPNDNSTFLWQFNKIDDQHISLSPITSCIGKTIYASVRDDIGYLLQVQAPYSADWITAVGRDEIIGFTMHDLSIGQFNGFNGAMIALSDTPDQHDNHTGYRLRSNGNVYNKNAQWFIAIKTAMQPHIQYTVQPLTLETMHGLVAVAGLDINSDTVSQIFKQISIH